MNEKRKFVAADKARLTVVLRKFRNGFLTYSEWKEAGEDTKRERGTITQHDTEAHARTAFEALCRTALASDWKEKKAIPESAYDEIPRAAVASPVAARARATAAANTRRR